MMTLHLNIYIIIVNVCTLQCLLFLKYENNIKPLKRIFIINWVSYNCIYALDFLSLHTSSVVDCKTGAGRVLRERWRVGGDGGWVWRLLHAVTATGCCVVAPRRRRSQWRRRRRLRAAQLASGHRSSGSAR